MTNPGFDVPDGAISVASLSELQNLNEAKIKAQLRIPVEDAFSTILNGLKNGLLDGIANALKGIALPGFGAVAQAARDGQQDLNDRTDLLSPLLDYGSCYMRSVSGWGSLGILPFDQQLGPMRGCELHKNGIRFEDKGLWDIRAQVTASWILLVPALVEWRVRVLKPDGSHFSEQRFTVTNKDLVTGTVVTSVVVPEPGFYVVVEMLSLAPGREVLGGPAWSRLTVQHISRQTDIGNDGSASSDTPRGQ